ncbi:MAG: lytic transglycosylase domain-containing protein, partial [Desulfobulbaceae bacterium]|nr:lytic transglycosylase domain-containing protein [Desulfobulbaceae bacterium]
MDFSFPASKPAWLSPLVPVLLALAFMTPLFSGCARNGGDQIAADAVNASAHTDEVKKATPVAAANVEDNLQPSEGDIAIESEIKALEHSGKWGKRGQEPSTMARGIDISKYDFPVVLNNQVTAYLDIFQGEQHEMFGRWLARSTKYLPMIRRELAKAGLPQDLAYLSMIESGYMPTARSAAGAVGLWQFMRDTGRRYTLRIDEYVDERRHIEKSTKAAVNMLGELYRDFGDWHLAVAAYNSGPARVQNGLSHFNAKTFWELADEGYLPPETKRYVPKLIAAIIIAKDPKKYGFDGIPYQSELNYDRLTVTPGLPLDAVALVTACDAETIKTLNPELHRGIIPPNSGSYMVRIPVGSKDLASRNLALLRTVHDTKYRRYVVKRRENLVMVCSHCGISRASLLKA